MKKNLLALAIAGAFVAPVAMADNANVTVYGIADASYENIDSGDTTAGVSGVTNNKISSNQSRIGFKGTEDLGGGLKAIFQVERQVDLDAASGPATSARNTFVGGKTRETVERDPHQPQEHHPHQHRRPTQSAGALLEGRLSPKIEQHDDDQKDDQHRARIDDDLNRGEESGSR